MRSKIIMALFLITSCVFEDKPATPEEILGEDKNGNQVRDDVEEWIKANYKDRRLQQGLIQYAKYETRSMMYAEDEVKSIEEKRKALETLHCVFTLGFEDVFDLTKDLDVEINNTKERLKASRKATANFSGQRTELKSKEYYLSKCEFAVVK